MAQDRSDRQPPIERGATPVRGPAGFMPPLVVAAIVIAGLYFARPVLEPFALAVLLSLMLAPAVRWLRHRGVGRFAAVALTVSLAFIVILGFAAAVGDEAINLAKHLPQYEANIAAKIRVLNGVVPGAGAVGRATRVFRDLSAEFGSSAAPLAADPSGAGWAPVPVIVRNSEPQALQVLGNVVGPMVLPLAAAGLVLLFLVMILVQREDLRDRVLRLAGARDLHRTTAAMNEAAERVSNYLLMQLGVGICYGVPIGIGLAVIGIPNALLWGMLGVVLRFVPYIGGPMTAIMPVVLAVAVAPGWGVLLWTVLLFAGTEVVIANLVEPWVCGRTTGLSAVAVVAAAVFWTWLWGVVGLLLATPLTVCLVVLGRYVPQLEFLAILLGNRPVLSPQESLYQRLLAHDPEEATEQAEEFARGNSLEAFFDEVAIPALVMAQADSDRTAVGGHRRAGVAEGLAVMLDNLAEDGLVDPDDAAAEGPAVACLAGRNELDLAAAWLLQHLLRRRGHCTMVFSPDAASPFPPDGRGPSAHGLDPWAWRADPGVDRLPLRGAAVVCLSLLSTNSAARARYLVRRIRRRARRARLVIGFWGQDPQEFSLAAAVAATAADQVVTTLAAAVAEVEQALGDGQRPGSDRFTRQSA